MIKINLLLGVKDEFFRKRFSVFAAERIRNISITLSHGWQPDSVDNKGFDLIIIDNLKNDRFIIYVRSIEAKPFNEIPLEENIDLQIDTYKKYRAIGYVNKYESADIILQEILKAYKGVCEHSEKNLVQDTDIVCVGSFFGGIGVTSIAVGIARVAAASYGRKVLILSNADISDLYDYFGDDIEVNKQSDKSFDMDMLLLNYVGGKSISPEKFLLKDELGVCIIRPPETGFSIINELYKEGTEHSFEGLLEHIKTWNLFDLIIIDVSGSCHRLESIDERYLKKTVVGRDIERKSFISENLWFRKIYEEKHGFSPVIADNFIKQNDLSEIFIQESDLDEEKKDRVTVYYDPKSLKTDKNRIKVDISGIFGSCMVNLYNEIF